jgi:predicted nucleotidyltransferase
VYKHHSESIKIITDKLKARKDVKAVILAGTIAQGFEDESSDIDLLIVVDDKDFKSRRENYDLKMIDKESAVYDGGYIDAKYISQEYIRQVGIKGSDAARYAFKDAKILYSKIDNLQSLINAAVKYPSEDKNKRIKAFCSQMTAWCWYACEGLKENNRYLLNYSISNAVLFGGRAILAKSEVLYPYHKWFMKVLGETQAKPGDLMENIKGLMKEPTKSDIICFRDSILEFLGVDKKTLKWPDYFVIHNEMNWLYQDTPIADI